MTMNDLWHDQISGEEYVGCLVWTIVILSVIGLILYAFGGS